MEKHRASQTNDTDTIYLASAPINTDVDNADLTGKETRQIVTPYAFFVADELLGTRLAGPFRRGFGMLIDLILVGLLTQVSSLILAAVAAWTFFRAGRRLKTKKRFNAARIFLRLLVALLLFVVALGIVNKINNNDLSNGQPLDGSKNSGNVVNGMGALSLTGKYLVETKAIRQQISQGECEPAYECVQTLGESLMLDVVAIGLDENAIKGVAEGFIGTVSESISGDEAQKLQQYLQRFAENQQAAATATELDSSEVQDTLSNNKVDNKSSKGLVAWLTDIAEELGLGFGWGAFYFSVFTAWWKGQTPGKKLLGIQVIRLDNQPLNLWESFGRYGGYGAGLATGLLGFLQVFWDPNRQAIQDKISETLVIDLRHPKKTFDQA